MHLTLTYIQKSRKNHGTINIPRVVKVKQSISIVFIHKQK